MSVDCQYRLSLQVPAHLWHRCSWCPPPPAKMWDIGVGSLLFVYLMWSDLKYPRGSEYEFTYTHDSTEWNNCCVISVNKISINVSLHGIRVLHPPRPYSIMTVRTIRIIQVNVKWFGSMSNGTNIYLFDTTCAYIFSIDLVKFTDQLGQPNE